MATWLGSTAGTNSGSAYPTLTSTITGFFEVSGVRFYAASPRTYTVTVDDTAVGSVNSSGGAVEEVTFDPILALGGATIRITPDTPAMVRYTTGTSFEYAPGVIQGEWQEFPGYRLPWELLLEPLVRSEWEVVCPGYVEGRPHAMPGHVVNGANGNGTTMPTSGRGHPRGRS